MDLNTICRCCLTNNGQLLTIYNGGTTSEDSLADMFNKLTGLKAAPDDKFPDKACLLCISDIKDFYSFKRKCENSHRTLQQLFLSKEEVHLNSPTKNLPSKSDTENEHIINATRYQMTPVESVRHKQTKVNNNVYSQRVYFETNNELTTAASSAISFENASLPIETITYLENDEQTPPPLTTERMENSYKKEFSDSETDSRDSSIEYISEEHINEPIEVLGNMFNTNHNAEVKETAVEDVFNHISSPQYVSSPEEEIYLSIVDEDLNFNHVEEQRNKIIEHPNNIDSSAGSDNQCAICGQGFNHRYDIINHLATHNQPYSCLFCENSYNDYNTLEVHSMKHNTINSHEQPKMVLIDSTHLEKSKVKLSSVKIFACDICLKRFRTKSALIIHHRIHTGKRIFKCKYCDKSFVQYTTWSNHEKTHTGEKPFKCEFCDKAFIQSGGLTKHYKIHHGEKSVRRKNKC